MAFSRSIHKRIGKLIRPFMSDNTIVVQVLGGFASQLNCWVLGEYLREKRNANVLYDAQTWFEKDGKSIDGKNTRNLELTHCFPALNFPEASEKQISFYSRFLPCYKFGIHAWEKFPMPFYAASEGGVFDDYDALPNILKKLRFAPEIIAGNKKFTDALPENSVAIHVRRGDFIGSIHDVLNENYFINAIHYLRERLLRQKTEATEPVFFFFSNGFDFVREKILPKLDAKISYVLADGNDNDNMLGDFYMMSRCAHQITSNSGFSLYAAHINSNPEKIVITPKNWYSTGSPNTPPQRRTRHTLKWTMTGTYKKTSC